MVSNSYAQVYARAVSGPSGGARGRAVFACVRGTQRAYGLGPEFAPKAFPTSNEGVTSETLAGAMLGYARASGLYQSHYATGVVEVRNLRSGRIVHKVQSGATDPAAKVGTDAAVATAVAQDGAVAWDTQVVESVPVPEAPCSGVCPASASFVLVTHQAIHALDGSGNRVLASGTDIDPSSLAITAGEVRWSQAGITSMASLR
jgi:hypothetical protein